MSEHLTEGERSVLAELISANRIVTVAELAERLGESEPRIVSILMSLSVKGLVTIDTQESTVLSLTEEGRGYAKDGLPEVRLFNAVKNLGGKSELEKAVAAAGLTPVSKGIAVNWARRNGWIKVYRVGSDSVLETLVAKAVSPVIEVLSLLQSGQDQVPSHLQQGLDQATERSLVTPKTIKRHASQVRGESQKLVQDLLAQQHEGIGDLSPEILASGTWRGKSFKPYNVEIEPPFCNYGKKHPYAEFTDWLREILVGLGFSEWYGPYVETEFWNNDVLFVPQDHVARDVQDQFRVTQPFDHGLILDKGYYAQVKAVHENGGDTGSKGWDWPFSSEVSSRLCLRSHTTPVSMRFLSQHRESPQKMFIVDRNFRAEKINPRHAQEFDQCEGIIMDKRLTLRDLMGYLTEICRRAGVEKLKFKPGQFPFTEPSVETFAKHETLGWFEVAPGGIFRPEVTRPLGIKDSVLAWGIGAMRLYMASMQISDIREVLSKDLSWLRRQYFVR
ncbi:MAG: phenylalanine--tRNA ligase subunit alpha [Candidatus Thorarchaeota archaeon]|nr:MAG: phenylalanine--tRNA ligase subunit alpha [Candidatus Thorarchaeota archaeon]